MEGRRRRHRRSDALGGQLKTLGTVLNSADPHLVSIVEAARTSTEEAGAAAKPAEGIVGLLADSDAKVRRLGGILDETSARAQRIESKLRILLVLPELNR